MEYSEKKVFLDKMKRIVNSDELTWEEKYDLIFSKDFSTKLRNSGVILDYYDPDSSYEEDVLAYVDAFIEYMERQEVISKYL